VEVPLDATAAHVIAQLPGHEGCVGFLASAKHKNIDEGEESDSEGDAAPTLSGLAAKLTADGGTLIHPSMALSSYGLDAASCREVSLWPVYADVAKQPKVFKKDIQEFGLGEKVYNYVKLDARSYLGFRSSRHEDKELAAARNYFRAPMLPWLQDGDCSGSWQTIELSMENDFAEAPKPIVTVHIAQEGDELVAACTNMAGDQVCSVQLGGDEIVAKLQSSLCEQLQWSSVALWAGSEMVSKAEQVSNFSLLTAKQGSASEHVSGCYQSHRSGVHPAGYSASGDSLANMIILESCGKAGLQYHFKGDYKRAEELRKLVMVDARWSVDLLGETHVVRITGKAKLDRFFVHERSGSDGMRLNGYACWAAVTIPLEQLERGQKEDHLAKSSPGSGWTCGSEEYRCSFFLPMCLLNALREKPEPAEQDGFVLRQKLNSTGSLNYPYNLMSSSSRGMWGSDRGAVIRVPQEAVDMIKHFRERLAGKAEVAIDEIMQLQSQCLSPNPSLDVTAAVGDHE